MSRDPAFAVLITGDPTQYTENKYGHYGQLFKNLLSEDGERWDFFDTRLGDYPTPGSVYTAYIITGSASTAHENLPWILDLKAFIRSLHVSDQRILGVCFGHQALASALGGVSDINPSGWEIGLYTLDWHQPIQTEATSKGLALPETILQVHRDHVVELPPGGEVLASTPQTPNQVFRLGDKVLGVQGHPEFFNDIVADLATVRQEAGVFSVEIADKAHRTLKAYPIRSAWVTWLKEFLLR